MKNLVYFKLFLFFLLMVPLAGITKALARPDPESQALRVLCPIGQKAGGIWGNERINSAIAIIGFGKNWPDSAKAVAYKLCNYGDYLK